jgi:hypothetical protein
LGLGFKSIFNRVMDVSFFTTTVYNRDLIPVLYPYRDISFDKLLYYIKHKGFDKHLGKFRAGKVKKTELPNFTPSGTFAKRGGHKFIKSYSGLVHLDFDNVGDLTGFKSVLFSEGFVHAFFVSPSGKGVKVFVRVNSGPELHKEAFKQVRNFFFKKYGVVSDVSCSDITRICFISSDPDLFYNQYSKVFEIGKPEPLPFLKPIAENPDHERFILQFTSRKLGPYTGENRNSYLFTVACNCNRYGISDLEALGIITALFLTANTSDFDKTELEKLVKSAYQYRNEFAIYKIPSKF